MDNEGLDFCFGGFGIRVSPPYGLAVEDALLPLRLLHRLDGGYGFARLALPRIGGGRVEAAALVRDGRAILMGSSLLGLADDMRHGRASGVDGTEAGVFECLTHDRAKNMRGPAPADAFAPTDRTVPAAVTRIQRCCGGVLVDSEKLDGGASVEHWLSCEGLPLPLVAIALTPDIDARVDAARRTARGFLISEAEMGDEMDAWHGDMIDDCTESLMYELHDGYYDEMDELDSYPGWDCPF